MSLILIQHSDILSCMDDKCIGTKVLNASAFQAILVEEVKKHEAALAAGVLDVPRVSGQFFLNLPPEANKFVSSGVGRRAAVINQNPDDYVVRHHRGSLQLFLKREFALPVEKVAAIVYTFDAYCKDPEVNDDEKLHLKSVGATHVLVAVLAFAGPEAPLGVERFVSNLAGGNNEALAWSADEIRAKAKVIDAYWKQYAVVAD